MKGDLPQEKQKVNPTERPSSPDHLQQIQPEDVSTLVGSMFQQVKSGIASETSSAESSLTSNRDQSGPSDASVPERKAQKMEDGLKDEAKPFVTGPDGQLTNPKDLVDQINAERELKNKEEHLNPPLKSLSEAEETWVIKQQEARIAAQGDHIGGAGSEQELAKKILQEASQFDKDPKSKIIQNPQEIINRMNQARDKEEPKKPHLTPKEEKFVENYYQPTGNVTERPMPGDKHTLPGDVHNLPGPGQPSPSDQIPIEPPPLPPPGQIPPPGQQPPVEQTPSGPQQAPGQPTSSKQGQVEKDGSDTSEPKSK